jgi:biopolymer transport protein ExbD
MRKRLSNITPQEEENEINLTPMLDVVFIMLIFFIVTATFIREIGLDINRPDQDQTRVVPERGAILVMIDNNDQIWIEGRQVDARAVQPNVGRMYAENPERPVVIQAAPDSSTRLLVTVMDASRQAGVWNISIAEGGL